MALLLAGVLVVQGGMVKGKRAKLILYVVLGILLAAAIILTININSTSELNKVSRTLRQYGYYFSHDDFYIAGNAAKQYHPGAVESGRGPLGGRKRKPCGGFSFPHRPRGRCGAIACKLKTKTIL